MCKAGGRYKYIMHVEYFPNLQAAIVHREVYECNVNFPNLEQLYGIWRCTIGNLKLDIGIFKMEFFEIREQKNWQSVSLAPIMSPPDCSVRIRLRRSSAAAIKLTAFSA